MSVKTIRYYSLLNDDPEDIEDFFMSIVADESSAEYIFPSKAEGKTSGLNQDRIDDNIKAYLDGKKPTDTEIWLRMAATGVRGAVYDGPSNYKSLKEAAKAEQELLDEAQQIRDDLEDPEFMADVLRAIKMASKTYTAFFEPNDSEDILALVDFDGENGALERVDGEWVDLEDWSFESLDESVVSKVDEKFVPVFDKAYAEDETLTRADIDKYIMISESE